MNADSQSNQPEVLKFNVEVGWNCIFNCEDCYRYVECPSPRKYELRNRGRTGQIEARMGKIRRKVAVLSGKGGVGKSTVTANLAMALAHQGMAVAVVDSDFYGPSIPGLLGINGHRLKIGRNGIIPVEGPSGIKVVSTGFLMDERGWLTWFDDLKRGAIEEFLAHVDYGELDYLVLDLPPGTGSETLNLMKYIPQLDGVIVVTIPSQVSQGVARRGLALCQRSQVPVLGVVENMSGFVCPKCTQVSHVLMSGGGKRLAQEMGVPFLGSIPLDQRIAETSDGGRPFITLYPDSPTAQSFAAIVEKIHDGKKSALAATKSPLVKQEEEEKLPEILAINVSYSCYGKICEECNNFIECERPRKQEIYERGRMGQIKNRMEKIRRKVAVLSGKGGVGKSTVTANLAMFLAHQGMTVAVVDSDFYGPSIPGLLGVTGRRLKIGRAGIIPVEGPSGIKVISTGFTLEESEYISWFDNLKRGAMEGFLAHVDYGELDYLVLDLPPGTGSETLNLMKCIPQLDGVIVVTIPSQVSQGVARRGLALCQRARVPILGVVENMSGFVCPHCTEVSNILMSGGGERLAQEMDVPFLGRIPMDQRIAETSDGGRPFITLYPKSPAALSFAAIVGKIHDGVNFRQETLDRSE